MATDPAKIVKKREKLEAVIAEAQKAIKALQDTCSHSGDVTYEYQSGHDGWSTRSDDDYWIDWHCKDCDKRWTTKQINSMHLITHVYPHAKPVRRK